MLRFYFYFKFFFLVFIMIFSNDLFLLLPELHWACIIILLLLFSTTISKKTDLILITRVGAIFLFSAFCFLLLLMHLPVTEFALFNYQYVSDSFTGVFKLAFVAIMFISVLTAFSYFFFERIFFVEYYFLLGFFCLSAFLLASANDLMMFYLAIELQSLILYTLAAIKRFNVFSTESGLKYFVLGALSSGLLLFGISFFYGFWGTLNFFDVKFLLLGWFSTTTHFATTVAATFVLSAILFKLAAAPFHIWTPDVYEGAPSAVVMIFTTLPKIALFVFVTRFFFFFLYDHAAVWYLIFSFSGLLSVLVGSVAALNQLNIKRLYAYSAIVNVGYLVTAISYGSLSGFSALFNYLVVYVLSTLGIFLVLLMFRTVAGFKKIKHLPDYKLLASYSSVFAIFFSLIFFSLAGVPPLAGFFTKFFLFKAIFAYDFLANPIVFVILVVSVLSAFYYIRVVRFVFFSGGRSPMLFLSLSREMVFCFVVLALFLILFVVFQQIILMSINFGLLSIFV